MQPDASWVARWLRMNDGGGAGGSFKPGLYAILLPGEEEDEAAREEDEYEEEEEAEAEEEEDDGEEELELASGVGGGAPAAEVAAAAGERGPLLSPECARRTPGSCPPRSRGARSRKREWRLASRAPR